MVYLLRDRTSLLGLLVWGLLLVGVIIRTFVKNKHSVTGVYRMAAEHFFQGQPMYPDLGVTPMGFLYLPGFAVVYAPFEMLGPYFGDSLWKTTGFLLLTYAAWSSCRDMEPTDRSVVFPVALLLSIPLVAGSLANGQANIHVLAFTWLATLAAFRQRWAGVAFWSGLALVVKPVAVVMLMLLAGVMPTAIPAILAGGAWALALPFVAADTDYVLSVYRDCWRTLSVMSFSENFPAADFTGILAKIGWSVEPIYLTITRAAAAIGTWLLALGVRRRMSGNGAAVVVVALGASYMCLFNPRAEGLTYAMAALPWAVVVAVFLRDGEHRMLWISAAAILVLMGCTAVTRDMLMFTRYWSKPAMFIGFLILTGFAFAQWRVRLFHLLDTRLARIRSPTSGFQTSAVT